MWSRLEYAGLWQPIERVCIEPRKTGQFSFLARAELIMTLGAIVESIRTALQGQADDVRIDRQPHETLIQVFVGKQLFLVKCSELAPDKDSPAIT